MKSSRYILVAILLLASSVAVQAQYIAMNTGVAQKAEALIKKNNALSVNSANGKTAVAFFNALLNARDVAFYTTGG